jgi:hypothetical protein
MDTDRSNPYVLLTVCTADALTRMLSQTSSFGGFK